jgi:hypothetical protein
MPSEIYENSVVSRGQFFTFSSGIILLCMILGGCIYFVGHSSSEEDDTDEDEVLMQVVLTQTRVMHLLETFDWPRLVTETGNRRDN